MQPLIPTILFEDQDILVLNKPAGVVVNEAVSAQAETVQAWVQRYLSQEKEQGQDSWENLIPMDFDDTYGSPEEIFQQRTGMVHRLDKDTSGVMIFAKNPGSLVHLLAQFRLRKVQKKYLCLVHGKPRLTESVVSAPLGRAQTDRKKFAVTISGRPATTQYQVLESFKSVFDKSNQFLFDEYLADSDVETKKLLRKNLNLYQAGFSFIACWPKTGRTHQIRVHMAHIHCPLVGDTTYVGRKRAKIDPLWCPRQFLHASFLELTHPRTHERISFEAPLSDDLQRVLDLIQHQAS